MSRLHTHPPVKTAQKPEPGGDGGSQWEPWAEPLRNVVRTQKDFTRPLRSFSLSVAEGLCHRKGPLSALTCSHMALGRAICRLKKMSLPTHPKYEAKAY